MKDQKPEPVFKYSGILTITGGDMWTLSLVPTSNLKKREMHIFVFLWECKTLPDCGAEPCVGLQNLRRLFLDDKGGLDEGVEEDVEAVGELGEDVHARLLAGDVQPLVDHLQLPDLLPIQPNNLSQVFTPDMFIRIMCFPAMNNVF